MDVLSALFFAASLLFSFFFLNFYKSHLCFSTSIKLPSAPPSALRPCVKRRGAAVRHLQTSLPGQLPGLPKEGSQAWAFSSCLHSSQRPLAQEFTFHSLGFSSHGGEAKQLKRRLGFLRACLSSFFSFSVNSIHLGKGSKNTIVARSRDREGEGESIDLHAHIVMDKTDLLLFAGLKKNK